MRCRDWKEKARFEVSWQSIPVYDFPPCTDTSFFEPSASFISLENKAQATFPVYLTASLLVTACVPSLLIQELAFSDRKVCYMDVGNDIF